MKTPATNTHAAVPARPQRGSSWRGRDEGQALTSLTLEVLTGNAALGPSAGSNSGGPDLWNLPFQKHTWDQEAGPQPPPPGQLRAKVSRKHRCPCHKWCGGRGQTERARTRTEPTSSTKHWPVTGLVLAPGQSRVNA